ncbi:MAG: hypothetical protein NTU98_03820 [Bacteroidetes bacterium]|nr:hypothetical protein [Bacteroidota bacterium]
MTLKTSITGFILLLFLIMYSDILIGQGNSGSPVQFHGTNRINGQYISLQGGEGIVPPSYLLDDLQMTLTVYDIPISASFFVTTEQSKFKQSINNFRIYLDAAALKSNGIKKATAFATSKLPPELVKAKDDLTKTQDLLKSDLLNETKLRDEAMKEYDKEKKNLSDTASAIAKSRLRKAKSKLDQAEAKVAKTKAKFEQVKAKLAEANNAIKQAQSLVKSPQQLTGKATDLAKGVAYSKMGRFLSIFPTLEIGKCRPNYSELTVEGIPVSGANIELNPGLFYAAFAMGKVNRAVDINSTSDPSYKRNLLFVRLGVGRKNESHLYFSYLRVEDKASSLQDSLVSDSLYIYPHSNHILATEGKLNLFKNKFTIEGEAAASLYTNNTQSENFDLKISGISAGLVKYFNVNASSSYDFAYSGNIGLNLSTTTITAGIKKIGSGYHTLGNPNLIADRLIYNGRIDQSFAKRQLMMSFFFRHSRDNLIGWKAGTTTMEAYGISASLRLRKAPFFTAMYMPNFQKTRGEYFNQDNSAYLVNAMAGYQYKMGSLDATTTVMFCRQYGNLVKDTAKNLSRTNSYSLNQNFSMVIPLSFEFSVNYSQSKISEQNEDIFNLMLKGTYNAFKERWQNSLGIMWSKQNPGQDKLGYFLNSRVKMWKGGDLEIQLEKNTFKNNIECVKSYNEFIGRIIFEVRW